MTFHCTNVLLYQVESLWQRRKRNIFQEGESNFSWFFPGAKCSFFFPGRNFHFGKPQTNFSGFNEKCQGGNAPPAPPHPPVTSLACGYITCCNIPEQNYKFVVFLWLIMVRPKKKNNCLVVLQCLKKIGLVGWLDFFFFFLLIFFLLHILWVLKLKR